MRWMALFLGLAFVTALGVMVGLRLPDESLVVVLGVLAGMGVSIPISVLVAWFAVQSFQSPSTNASEPLEVTVPQRTTRSPRRRPNRDLAQTDYAVQDDEREYPMWEAEREYPRRSPPVTPNPRGVNAPAPYTATGYQPHSSNYALPPRRFRVIGEAELADDEHP